MRIAVATLAVSASIAAAQVPISLDDFTDITAIGQRSSNYVAADTRSELFATSFNEQTPICFEMVNQVRFVSAYTADLGGPTAAKTWRRHLDWTFVFTVADPDDRGYELVQSNRLHGYITLLGPERSPGTGPAAAEDLFASVSLNTRFDDDASDGVDTGLSNLQSRLVVSASRQSDPADLMVNDLIDDSASASLGTFTGTRQFAVRITTQTAPSVVTLLNPAFGDGALRFGARSGYVQDPLVVPAMLDALVGEPTDLSDSDLGVFFTLGVTFTPKPGDFDKSDVVNISDLFAFVNAFTQTPPDPRTDWDGNGTINISDLFAFINEFTNAP
ncbi:MAG: GC-type dockerin domain-anchored protein [Planctomycetota bacterium]